MLFKTDLFGVIEILRSRFLYHCSRELQSFWLIIEKHPPLLGICQLKHANLDSRVCLNCILNKPVISASDPRCIVHVGKCTTTAQNIAITELLQAQTGPFGGDYAQQPCQSTYSECSKSLVSYLTEICAFSWYFCFINKNVYYDCVILVLVIFPLALAKTSLGERHEFLYAGKTSFSFRSDANSETHTNIQNKFNNGNVLQKSKTNSKNTANTEMV